MKIFINNEPLSFTLENEKFIGQIMKALQIWLKKSEFIISAIKIDDTELTLDEIGPWKEKQIDEIENLYLTVNKISELRLSSIKNMIQYIRNILAALEEKNIKLISEINQDINYIKESLNFIFSYYKSNSSVNLIENFNSIVDNFNWNDFETISKEETQKAWFCLKEMLSRLEEVHLEEIDPIGALKLLTEKLQVSLKEICEVSILLQTGKDKKAMASLIVFSDVLEHFVGILVRMKASRGLNLDEMTINGMVFQEFYNELNNLLKELVEAFGINDSVLIGDLLEYEIAPRLESLINFVRSNWETESIKNGTIN